MLNQIIGAVPVSGLEVGRISAEFQFALSDVRAADIRPLPDLSSQINHDGKTVTPSLPGQGLYLDQQLGLGADQAGYAFNLRPGARIGKEDSHNGVFFGPLDRDGVNVAEVAVKRNAESPTANLGEIALHQHMQNLGIPTLRPAGILTEGDPLTRSYLMTHAEAPIKTLDGIEWHTLDVEERWLEADKALDIMAMLHPHLLFHNDLDLRNVAFKETGNVVVVDPELMVSALGTADVALSEIAAEDRGPAFNRIVQLLGSDFGSLTQSLEKYIVNTLPLEDRPQNDAAMFKLMRRRVYLPYRARIEEMDTPHRDMLVLAFNEMVSQKKRASQGKSVARVALAAR
jgi:hypothetical protein